MIFYRDKKQGDLIDFKTLQRVLNMKKTTLYRRMKTLNIREVRRYKNQFLFKEETLYVLMKFKLLEKLDECGEN
jgi:hypothetical protein